MTSNQRPSPSSTDCRHEQRVTAMVAENSVNDVRWEINIKRCTFHRLDRSISTHRRWPTKIDDQKTKTFLSSSACKLCNGQLSQETSRGTETSYISFPSILNKTNKTSKQHTKTNQIQIYECRISSPWFRSLCRFVAWRSAGRTQSKSRRCRPAASSRRSGCWPTTEHWSMNSQMSTD